MRRDHDALTAGYRHPLPWVMPARDGWVNLEPALILHEGAPKQFKLRLGLRERMSAVFTETELRQLRDQIDAALAAPFLVRILGGPVAERWMPAAIERRMDEVLRFHPNLAIAHAGRPGSADELVDAWARDRGVHTFVDPAGPAAGGSAVLIFMTADDEQNLAWSASCGEIPTWWCRLGPHADRTPI